MEIKKINELKNINSFLQVDFTKGFEYIDKAGKIINIFGKIPKYINPDALLIDKTEKEEIKVTPFSFWSHFISPDSLGQAADAFANDSDRILKIIGIEKITRIGWRNHFIYRFCESKKRGDILNKFIRKDNLKFNSVGFSYKEKDLDFNFRVEKLLNKEEDNEKLLIDVDLFKKFSEDNLLQLNEQKNILREMREKIQSDSFLSIINFILTEKDAI